MTAEQSAAARRLLEAARRDWWQPGHPHFGVTALDTESFALDAGGRRGKGRVPEPVLVELPRPCSTMAAGGCRHSSCFWQSPLDELRAEMHAVLLLTRHDPNPNPNPNPNLPPCCALSPVHDQVAAFVSGHCADFTHPLCQFGTNTHPSAACMASV